MNTKKTLHEAKDGKQHHFAALIAAYNEEESIKDTVIAVSLLPGVAGVIVANDGSTDNTVEEATRAGAIVVSNEKNSGKGAAMELAAQTLELIRPFGELDGVLLLDGDLGKCAGAALDLLEPVAADEADLVIGILPSPTTKAGFGWTRSLARDGIKEFGNGYESKAPLSGQRALSMECLQAIRPFAGDYAMEVAMTIGALRQSYRIVEIPVDMQHRSTGRNLKGFMHRGKQFMQIYRLLDSYSKRK